MRFWFGAMIAVAAACSGGEPQAPTVKPVGPAPRADAASTDATVDAPATPDAATAAVAPRPDARPPAPDDWVDVAVAIPEAVLDMRYATAENFTGKTVYPVARCLLRRSVAERLARAAVALRAHDRRFLIWDCYRPSQIQKLFWELVPDPRYVAKPVYARDGTPKSGSRHSRGAAVDIGLVDEGGKPVVLPTAHDDFSRAAHRKQAKKSAGAAELAILDEVMLAEGFIGMPTEWWHYDAPDASKFPFSDVPLDTPTEDP